jgi:glycerol kinase
MGADFKRFSNCAIRRTVLGWLPENTQVYLFPFSPNQEATMAEFIVSIDQGTTSSRAIVYDQNAEIRGVGQKEFPQIFPESGWVEHNPDDIWETTQYAIGEAIKKSGISPKDIAGIGITNQRETSLIWDRETGKPVYNAIVWQDRRTAPICQQLFERGLERRFSEKTGLLFDPYFSGTKWKWMMDHIEGLYARAKAGKLKAGTIDTFLIDRLTGGDTHVTDVTNASRTLLMDLRTLSWDEELASELGVPLEMMPRIASSSELYGKTKGLSVLPDGIPICGIAGDQQAALFGQACFKVGEAKCTFGTGAFMLMNTGKTPVPSKSRLITTVAWKVGDTVNYALEGSAFIAGAAVQWLRDGLQIIKSSSEIEALASQVDSSDGVVFVPALAGLGAPYWRADATGVLHGITRRTTKAHIARATLEGIALQNYEILRAMEKDSNISLKALKVDGGAAVNNLMMQFQADILKTELIRPKMLETTAMGAAFLAGLSAGVWSGLDDITKAWAQERRFTPSMDDDTHATHIRHWRAAIELA